MLQRAFAIVIIDEKWLLFKGKYPKFPTLDINLSLLYPSSV